MYPVYLTALTPFTQIYDVNLASDSTEMQMKGSIVTKDLFHSLAWGSKGMDVSNQAITSPSPATLPLLFLHP